MRPTRKKGIQVGKGMYKEENQAAAAAVVNQTRREDGNMI